MRFSSKTFRRRRANKKRNVRKTKRRQRGGTLFLYSSSVPAHAAKPIAQRLDDSKIVDDTQQYFEEA